jgi:hypothetical protein
MFHVPGFTKETLDNQHDFMFYVKWHAQRGICIFSFFPSRVYYHGSFQMDNVSVDMSGL